MKLSISNIAWSKENDQEMYKYISDIGFHGIEIAPTRIFEINPYDRLKEAEEFSDFLKRTYNFEISSMQSIWYGKNQNIFSSKMEREELLEYTKKAIDFANKIKCHNLVFGCPKNRNINRTEDYNLALEFFRTIGEYAKEKNTIFAIEPNPIIYKTNFINTTIEAFEIVKDINSEGVKVNVDLGTIIENDEKIEIITENCKLINHIHISEPNLDKIKVRELHKKLYKILHEQEYKNYISIEMKNTQYIQDVKDVINYIKEVF